MSKKDKNNDNVEKLIKNTEVKFMMDSEAIMTGNFKLQKEFIDVFNVKDKPADMKIWYLDTKNEDFNQANWSVRFRYHDDCDFELTFKKRYDVDQLDDIEGALRETEKRFLREGFLPEVDMGFEKHTLSFSYIKKFPLEEYYLSLALEEAKKLAIKSSPPIFDNWGNRNNGYKVLENSILYGPVDAVEYKGTLYDLDIKVEIWKLDKYYPELSFNVKTKKSEEIHGKIIDLLEEKKWLLPKDLLKTQLLYKYYRRKNSTEMRIPYKNKVQHEDYVRM